MRGGENAKQEKLSAWPIDPFAKVKREIYNGTSTLTSSRKRRINDSDDNPIEEHAAKHNSNGVESYGNNREHGRGRWQRLF
jgi:hypothetical protein